MADSGAPSEATLRLDDGVHARAWLARHLQSLLSALGHLSRAPLASFMTAAVLGVALALPAALVVVLDNVAQVSGRWQGGASLSLFMSQAAGESPTRNLAREIGLIPGVIRVNVTSPNEALAQYRALGADPAVLNALGDENPMPWMLSIGLDEATTTPEKIEALVAELRQDPMVELIEYDLRWLNRLLALMTVGRRAAAVLALVLAVGVLLVIGNTIRLEIERRRSEIHVLQVIGATNAFIRRPLLYTGMWYGLAGGVLAAGVLAGSLAALEEPVTRLAATYDSPLRLLWPGPVEVLALLACGAFLGLTGAWVAVSRYLVGVEDLAGRDL